MYNDSKVNSNLNTQRAAGMTDIEKTMIAVTTTNVSVWANDMKIGFVQSASPSESRPITKVQALGVEGVVQIVAGNTNGGQLSLSRLAVYNGNLFNALGLTRTGQFVKVADMDTSNSSVKTTDYATFGNPFKTLKDQRVPIEIKVKTDVPSSLGATVLIETYLDCWLSAYSKTIASNTITLTEQATIQYSDLAVETTG